MNKSQIGLSALVLVIILASGAYFFAKNDNQTPQAAQVQSTTTNNPPAATGNTFTKEDVATHNTAENCWTIIENKVYDITSYVPRHPGGDEILRACGNDSTTLFNTRTTPEGERVGSGTPHSDSARNQLQDYYKGDLK